MKERDRRTKKDESKDPRSATDSSRMNPARGRTAARASRQKKTLLYRAPLNVRPINRTDGRVTRGRSGGKRERSELIESPCTAENHPRQKGTEGERGGGKERGSVQRRTLVVAVASEINTVRVRDLIDVKLERGRLDLRGRSRPS